jgi:hypothetical protein
MLKSIDPILTPDLLWLLASMGTATTTSSSTPIIRRPALPRRRRRSA